MSPLELLDGYWDRSNERRLVLWRIYDYNALGPLGHFWLVVQIRLIKGYPPKKI